MMLNQIQNNQVVIKIKEFLKNPIYLFGFLALVFTFLLMFGCHFHLPDYYTNRKVAEELAQLPQTTETIKTYTSLLSFSYKVYNQVFQLWGYFIALFVFTLIFRINTFKGFKQLSIMNKKPFIYFWFNISYPIWAIFFVPAFMVDLEKFVYNYSADSFGIPYFFIISSLVSFASIYYPVMNVLSFITFNTKIKRIFYNIVWYLILFVVLLSMLMVELYKFTYGHIVLDFYYLVTVTLIIYSIGYKKDKQV